MLEPVSNVAGVSFFGWILDECLDLVRKAIPEHIVGAEAHHHYKRFSTHFHEHVQKRLTTGHLPPNEHILGALRRSLAGTALVFGYTLHDPERRFIKDILRQPSWNSFQDLCHRLHELARDNIIPENPFGGDEWLAKLIALAKKPENFADFDFQPILTDNGTTVLVAEQANDVFRDFIHREFLRWADIRITRSHNFAVPRNLEISVREGLKPPRCESEKLTFYEIFCLFFRAELKWEEIVHRTYVIDVLAELKQDIDRVIATLPTLSSKQQFQGALSEFGDFPRFQDLLTRQNTEILDTVRRILGVVEGMRTELHGVQESVQSLLEGNGDGSMLLQFSSDVRGYLHDFIKVMSERNNVKLSAIHSPYVGLSAVELQPRGQSDRKT